MTVRYYCKELHVSPAGVSALYLKLKNGVPIKVHIELESRKSKIFVMKAHTRRVLQVAALNSKGDETHTIALNRTKFYGVKAPP